MALFDTHPHLKDLWHPTLNTDTDRQPDTLRPGSNKEVYWLCPEHGHPWKAKVYNVAVKNQRCGVCYGRQVLSGFNDFASQCPEKATYWDYGKNVLTPDGVRKADNRKYWFLCEQGHSFDAALNHVCSGRWCPYCAGKKALPGESDLFTTHPEVKSLWSSNNTMDPRALRANSNKKALWTCGAHEWSAAIYSVTAQGYRCPYCSGRYATPENNLRDGRPDLLPFFSNTNVLPPEDFTLSSGRRVQWDCGAHRWEARVSDVAISGTWCPKCPTSVSKPQREVEEFVRSLLPEDTQIYSDREMLDGREIDIYIPSLSLGFEYNGTYWHSSAQYRKQKAEAEKTKRAIDCGIRLIHIWEHDWRDRRDIVQNQIRSALKAGLRGTTYARKTYVTSITYQEASKFLTDHHIQGSTSGTYYLGLRSSEDSTLVAVMVLTYSKKTEELTLDRYATAHNVPGGHTKMVKYVERTYTYRNLVTFADLQHSYGDLYKTTGWIYDKTLPPDYKYLYKGQVYHKFNFRRRRFRDDPLLSYDPSITESQLADLNNIYRIWDCGKIRFIKPHPGYVV